ncbi:hypothetical protein Tco_0218509 [Tanacetum coccineum]
MQKDHQKNSQEHKAPRFKRHKKLVRLIDVTIEQWLDLKYRNHETMDKKIKNGVMGTWLIRSYKQQFNDYVEIKRNNDVFECDTNMEYHPFDVEFAIRGDDEEVLIDKELSDLEKTCGNPQMITNQECLACRCSRHMTGNMSYLTNYEEIDGGYVAFGGNPKGGKITGKGKAAQSLLIVEENLHIRFSENIPNVVGSRPDWLFDIDALTRTMNFEPIVTGTQSNGFTSTKTSDNAGQARKETKPVKDYILLPLWTVDPPYSQDPKCSHDDGSKPSSDDGKKVNKDLRKDSECKDQEKEDNVNNTNNVNAEQATNEVNA